MTRYTRNPQCSWNKWGENFIIFEPGDKPHFHELNETASHLWETLSNRASKKDLQESILSEFEVHPEVALQEVEEFIQILKDKNLILEA